MGRINQKKPSIESLKPVTELGANKPHGTRLRYMSGCKCTACRAANSNYQTNRARARTCGEWNGLVISLKAKNHINRLSEIGIGYKTVADIAGLAPSTVFKIKTGEQTKIRKLNEVAILKIDSKCLPDSALISSGRTLQRIKWLMNEGFTEKQLAKRLGYKKPYLQFNKKRITAKTAMKIEKFYNLIRLGEQEETRQDTIESFLS